MVIETSREAVQIGNFSVERALLTQPRQKTLQTSSKLCIIFFMSTFQCNIRLNLRTHLNRLIQDFIAQNYKLIRRRINSMKIVLYLRVISQYILTIVCLNYFNGKVCRLHEQILTGKYVSQTSDRREVFTYFESLMFVHKSALLLLAWICMRIGSQILKKIFPTNRNQFILISGFQNSIFDNQQNSLEGQENNLNHQFKSLTQVDVLGAKIDNSQVQYTRFDKFLQKNNQFLLGFLGFLLIILFEQLQNSVSIIHLGATNIAFLLFLFNYVNIKQKRVQDINRSFLYHLLTFIASVLLIASSFAIKMYSQLVLYYFGNYNLNFVWQQLGPICLFLCYFIAITCFYLLTWKFKTSLQNRDLRRVQDMVRSNRSTDKNPLQQCKLNLKKTLQLMYGMTKYTCVFLGLYVVGLGELFRMVRFCIQYSFVVRPILELSVINFFKEFTLYYCLVRFDPIVFFSLIGSLGVLEKSGHCILGMKSSIHCYPYHVIFIVLGSYLFRQLAKAKQKYKT